MPKVFRVLVLCTGNICRSPQVAQLIRARASEISELFASQLLVESAGTRAVEGAAMDPKAAAISAYFGGNPEDHVARQITADMVREADLVLAMAGEHLRAALKLVPQASRYTFRLTDFVALLETTVDTCVELPGDWSELQPADKLRAAVRWIAARRGFLPAEDAQPADIVDPYRRSDKAYEASACQIVEALDRAHRSAVSLIGQVGS